VEADRRALARRAGDRAGFTLVEVALVTALLGVLATIAISGFRTYQDRARRSQVIVDLKTISTELDGYEIARGSLPAALADVDPSLAAMRDVWGRPYFYTRVAGTPRGKLRKDKFLVPINYDLYSAGPDGKTTPPLTAKASRDDVIRASNGSFYGPAQQY
jgi:general secretion pathway protein G